ncbi:DUF438 domain-containing protein, partial [Candidatus Aerophobetes bacterium]|nr:DUF438 domain-containing protein [Candidatus Aerophobetes bacterium]
MSEIFGGKGKKEILKEIIKALHQGESPDLLKDKFKQVLKTTTPAEIAKVEEELIKEGLPREQIRKLCEVHLKVFEEALVKEETPLPSWHPIHILKEEHKILTDFSQNLYLLCQNLKEKGTLTEEDKEKLHSILHHLKESESHYLREENVLFP